MSETQTWMRTAPDAGSLAGDVNWLLNRVWLGFGEARSRALEPLGLSVREQVVLRAIGETNATQLELAVLVRMDKSVLTTTIDSLEHKQLVRRRPDPHDRRAKRPELTAKGRDVSAAAALAAEGVQDRLLARLPEQTRDEFVSILRDFAFGPFAGSVSFPHTREQ